MQFLSNPPRRKPGTYQEFLMKAAVLPGAQGFLQWQKWSQSTASSSTDINSTRLLPLVYKHLIRSGKSDERFSELKKAYLATMMTNEILFRKATEVLELLGSAGIETILLKGIALSEFYFEDSGVRPMSDFDILVRTKDRELAVDLLHAGGWQWSLSLPNDAWQVHHGLPLEDQTGHSFDLHWYLHAQNLAPSFDETLWQNARVVQFRGQRTRILDSANFLLHVCVHGMRWEPEQNLRWIVDSLTILKKDAESLDWDYFIEQSRKRGLSLYARRALVYLRKAFGAAIPFRVLVELNSLRPSRTEIAEYRLPNPAISLKDKIARHLVAYARFHSTELGRTTNFIEFSRRMWRLNDFREAPRYLVAQAMRNKDKQGPRDHRFRFDLP